VGELDDRERDHDQAAGDVGDEENQPAVDAIGENSRRDREDHVREDPRAADDAEEERVGTLAVHDHEQRHEVQPVSDPGDELAREEPDERAIRQQSAIRGERSDGADLPLPGVGAVYGLGPAARATVRQDRRSGP
jgi:hypothetical protein